MSHFMDFTLSGCHNFWMSHFLDVMISGCHTFWMSHFLDVTLSVCHTFRGQYGAQRPPSGHEATKPSPEELEFRARSALKFLL
jgi:hypothetical protein